MSRGADPARVRHLLETNRTWAAYALADLDPHYRQGARWIVEGDAVVLLYRALTPTVLFVLGDPRGAQLALSQVPPSHVQFSLKGVHRALLRPRLVTETESRMWRMVLRPEDFPGLTDQPCERLQPEQLEEVRQLMAGAPDRPDAFSEGQLQSGTFFGVREDGRLLSMAGTHVLSRLTDVAAVGNVFTHPQHRGKGYGRAVSAAVVKTLIERGFGTIVLNVAMDNEPALKLYRNLGFWPFCGYYEGVGTLETASHGREGTSSLTK